MPAQKHFAAMLPPRCCGGAVAGLGHYVTFADSDGQRLPYLHPLDAVGVNGVHAVVVAPALVRVEVFRSGHTYQVLVTKHSPALAENGQRPSLRTVVIFRGTDGYLNQDLWRRDKTRAGSLLPEFYTPGGEPMEIFAALEPALLAAVGGSCCLGCRHSHYLIANGDGGNGTSKIGSAQAGGATSIPASVV